jgi:hypothetical protein
VRSRGPNHKYATGHGNPLDRKAYTVRRETDAAVAKIFRNLDRLSLLAGLDAAGIAFAEVNDMQRLQLAPQQCHFGSKAGLERRPGQVSTGSLI